MSLKAKGFKFCSKRTRNCCYPFPKILTCTLYPSPFHTEMSSFLGQVGDKVKTVVSTVAEKVKSVTGIDENSLQNIGSGKKPKTCSSSKVNTATFDVVHNEAKHEFTVDVEGDNVKAELSYTVLGSTQQCQEAKTSASTQQCQEAKTSASTLSEKSCKQAELLNISVPESARHKGVGSALVIAFLNWANSPNQNICDIRLASATRDYIAKNASDIMMKSAGKYDMILSSRKV